MRICKLFRRKPEDNRPLKPYSLRDHINAQRHKEAEPLQEKYVLRKEAERRAVLQRSLGRLDGHQDFVQRSEPYLIKFGFEKVAEICLKTTNDDPEDIVRRFMASESHRTVLTRSYWKYIGYHIDPVFEHGQLWFYVSVIFAK